MARAPSPTNLEAQGKDPEVKSKIKNKSKATGEGARATCSAFYRRQASNAIVAIATSAVAIRYTCDLTQLFESDNSPNMS